MDEVEKRAREFLAVAHERMWRNFSARQIRAGEFIGDDVEIAIDALKAALASQQPQGVPEGFVLVPIELTPAMEDAMSCSGVKHREWCWEVWDAALAAAPSPEAQS